MTDLRDRTIALYKPPFRFECGYIFDANGQMVADQGGPDGYCLRIRGWGRIGKEVDGEALQDDVGHFIAGLLTIHWPDTDDRRQEP